MSSIFYYMQQILQNLNKNMFFLRLHNNDDVIMCSWSKVHKVISDHCIWTPLYMQRLNAETTQECWVHENGNMTSFPALAGSQIPIVSDTAIIILCNGLLDSPSRAYTQQLCTPMWKSNTFLFHIHHSLLELSSWPRKGWMLILLFLTYVCIHMRTVERARF